MLNLFQYLINYVSYESLNQVQKGDKKAQDRLCRTTNGLTTQSPGKGEEN
jgi:hypothetical protein